MASAGKMLDYIPGWTIGGYTIMMNAIFVVLQDADVSTDTLLFVDDNEDLRKYIRMTFGDSYQVVDVDDFDVSPEMMTSALPLLYQSGHYGVARIVLQIRAVAHVGLGKAGRERTEEIAHDVKRPAVARVHAAASRLSLVIILPTWQLLQRSLGDFRRLELAGNQALGSRLHRSQLQSKKIRVLPGVSFFSAKANG